ncbi:Apc15p protein-domain-containing protein [Xylaria nigripes]|nr:Apc15p protein-domain-containing protein [Xylaria nigripes]
MYSLLPDLSPRDSHSLWYASSRNPFSSSNAHDAHFGPHTDNHPHGLNGAHRRGAHLIDCSPLARLRADELNIECRRQNVTDFGCAWLKPPGLSKTLHQLREERREVEEHQEALRREQLAQELAEAEAEAVGAVVAGVEINGEELEVMLEAVPDGEEGIDDVQLDGARDLDDDIPDAAEADFEFSGDEDEDQENEEEEEDEEDDEDDDEERDMRAAHAQQQQLVAQRMRNGEDLARGRDSTSFYGADEEIDDEDQSQMIEEDDIVGGHADGDEMGMEVDLDEEIPEAESLGGYEHTDTEADISSTMLEEDPNSHSHISFPAPSTHVSRFRHSFARSDAPRSSLALSDILSRDGSSYLESSPAVPRQFPSRRGRG